MSHVRAYSSPQLLSSSTSNTELPEEGLEGLATNVKLLLKLIQEHNVIGTRENEERKFQRVNGMMLLLDDVRSRVQRFQSYAKRKSELRRCITELRPNVPNPKDKRPSDVAIDEKDKLRKELNASLAARHSLQAMCSCLGKEKQIMASELARKAQELAEMEELISDLKAQNDMLVEKLHDCSSEEKEKMSNGVGIEGNIALQERDKVLSEQLKKSLDAYRSLKRRFRDAQEEIQEVHASMEEMKVEVQAGIERIHGYKEEVAKSTEETIKFEDEIAALEHMLDSLSMKISKHEQKKT